MPMKNFGPCFKRLHMKHCTIQCIPIRFGIKSLAQALKICVNAIKWAAPAQWQSQEMSWGGKKRTNSSYSLVVIKKQMYPHVRFKKKIQGRGRGGLVPQASHGSATVPASFVFIYKVKMMTLENYKCSYWPQQWLMGLSMIYTWQRSILTGCDMNILSINVGPLLTNRPQLLLHDKIPLSFRPTRRVPLILWIFLEYSFLEYHSEKFQIA